MCTGHEILPTRGTHLRFVLSVESGIKHYNHYPFLVWAVYLEHPMLSVKTPVGTVVPHSEETMLSFYFLFPRIPSGG
jgi:hypothetical protein